METKELEFIDQECKDILLANHVLSFPTETVYGLGVVYDSKAAFDELCALKNRVPDKPFSIMVSSKKDIERFTDLDEKSKRLVDTFMPGEITLLFKAKKGLFPWLTLSSTHVGIRIPDAPDVVDLIARIGKPLLVTSANMSSCPALYTLADVKKVFDGKVRGIVKGKCKSNLPSTIVEINDDGIKLIRQGSISFDSILNVYNIK